MRHNKDTTRQLWRVWKRTSDRLTQSLSEAATSAAGDLRCFAPLQDRSAALGSNGSVPVVCRIAADALPPSFGLWINSGRWVSPMAQVRSLASKAEVDLACLAFRRPLRRAHIKSARGRLDG